MATKPDFYPEWATNDVDVNVEGSLQPNKVRPPSAKRDNGFVYGEKPPLNWFNYLFNKIREWIVWSEESIDDNTLAIENMKKEEIKRSFRSLRFSNGGTTGGYGNTKVTNGFAVGLENGRLLTIGNGIASIHDRMLVRGTVTSADYDGDNNGDIFDDFLSAPTVTGGYSSARNRAGLEQDVAIVSGGGAVSGIIYTTDASGSLTLSAVNLGNGIDDIQITTGADIEGLDVDYLVYNSLFYITAIIGCDGGKGEYAYITSDNGDLSGGNWKVPSGGVPQADAQNDSLDQAIVGVDGNGNNIMMFGSRLGRIYRTVNPPLSTDVSDPVWSENDLELPLNNSISCFAHGTNNGQDIWLAGVSASVTAPSTNVFPQLYQSLDGGDTWGEVLLLPEMTNEFYDGGKFYGIADLAYSNGVFFLASARKPNVYMSFDGGVTWSKKITCTVDPADNDVDGNGSPRYVKLDVVKKYDTNEFILVLQYATSSISVPVPVMGTDVIYIDKNVTL